jgi:hypothetical protein
MPNEQQTSEANLPVSSEDAETIDNKYCNAPMPSPISDCGNCMKWYITNVISKQAFVDDTPAVANIPVLIQFEVVYEFSLCLKGRQPGKLLYTTSLIPQEEFKIYISGPI